MRRNCPLFTQLKFIHACLFTNGATYELGTEYQSEIELYLVRFREIVIAINFLVFSYDCLMVAIYALFIVDGKLFM